ncbi:MAG: hypothetical protein ACK5JU_06605 [Bacteroidales bacterium]
MVTNMNQTFSFKEKLDLEIELRQDKPHINKPPALSFLLQLLTYLFPEKEQII